MNRPMELISVTVVGRTKRHGRCSSGFGSECELVTRDEVAIDCSPRILATQSVQGWLAAGYRRYDEEDEAVETKER
jgi:hypothetical protein